MTRLAIGLAASAFVLLAILTMAAIACAEHLEDLVRQQPRQVLVHVHDIQIVDSRVDWAEPPAWTAAHEDDDSQVAPVTNEPVSVWGD